MISDPNNLPHIQNSMAEFSFSEIDQNIEIMNQFMEINPSPNTNFHNVLGFSSENFTFHPQLGITASSGQNFHASYNHSDEKNQLQVISEVIPLLLEENQTGEKKNRTSIDLGDSSSWNSSSQVSEDGVRTKKNSRKGKRSRGNEEGEEKLKEVVHVRARRGQATDSHSLAERVRRGKINEKLKSLQDIVPGCYKTMGMAVMLDEIINYVQSLQTQVEFLSMKLAAASRFYDFNLDTDAMEAMQNAKAYEEQKAQRILGEEFQHQGLMNSTQLGSFDLTFGTYPQLPYST